MSFAVGADAYDRFMGRYSVPLAPAFAEFAAVIDGQRVVDVGCGPGALTAELVKRLGPTAVSAVDPSPSFVAAAHARYPAVDVSLGVMGSQSVEVSECLGGASFDVRVPVRLGHFAVPTRHDGTADVARRGPQSSGGRGTCKRAGSRGPINPTEFPSGSTTTP